LVSEPLWLTFDRVCQIHDQQLVLHGGLAGFNEAGLVHSAIEAPHNEFLYSGEDNVLTLGISLCYALAKNHGFLDGNKRTAAFSMIEFMAINGFDLVVPDDNPEEPLLGHLVSNLTADIYDKDELYDILEPYVLD
jgi:death-on-curing protein